MIYHIKIQNLDLFDRPPIDGGRGGVKRRRIWLKIFLWVHDMSEINWFNEQRDPKTFAQNETPYQWSFVIDELALFFFSLHQTVSIS